MVALNREYVSSALKYQEENGCLADGMTSLEFTHFDLDPRREIKPPFAWT
jgi:hypothetical protein